MQAPDWEMLVPLINSVFTMHPSVRFCGFFVVIVAFQNPAVWGVLQETEKITFEDNAGPVFKARCAACHNPDKKSADLDLTTFTGIMAGGASGASVEAGDSSASYLYNLVTHEDEPSMPPGGTKIPDEEIAIIAKWIDGGALESKSSKASTKKKTSLAAGGSGTVRPEVVAVFPRLEMEPVNVTRRAGTITAIATHPWAPLLAVASAGQVLIYDANSLQLAGVLPFPEGTVHSLRFSRSGEILLAGGGKDAASGKVVLWDVASAERIAVIGDELDTVLAADISSDHSLVALGGPQKVVRVYSTEDGSLVYEIRKHTDWITALEFSPDSVLLATGDRSGGLFVWHGPTGNEYLTLNGHTAAITATPWRFDSNVLASSSDDGTVRAWEMENGGVVKSISAHGGGVTNAVFDREGRLATVGRDAAAKLWNPTGDPLHTFAGLGDIGTASAISVDSARAFAGDWAGNLLAWKTEDATLIGRIDVLPIKLADRLVAAENTLATTASGHSQASAFLGQLQEQLAAAKTRYEEQKKVAGDLQAMLTADEKKLAELAVETEAIQKREGEYSAEKSRLATLVPELKVLADQAAKVAEIDPADDLLKSTSHQISDRLTLVTSRSVELDGLIAADMARKGAIVEESTRLQTVVSERQKAFGEATVAAESTLQSIAGLEQQISEAQAAVVDLTSKLSAATAECEKWKQEIQFVADLAALRSERNAADENLNVVAGSREAADLELEAAKQKSLAAAAALEAAEKSRQEIEDRIATLRGIR